MMDKENNLLSDDELDAVAGGTAAEINELTELLGVDKFALNDALKAYGVIGTALFSANNYENGYFVEGGTISHAELIKRIRESKGLV